MTKTAMKQQVKIAAKLNVIGYLLGLLLIDKLVNKRDNNFISKVNRLKLYARDNFTCIYCGSTNNLSLDHIVPQSTEKNHNFDNLVTCCKQCNSSKNDSSLASFIRKLNLTGKNTTITAKDVIKQASKEVK